MNKFILVLLIFNILILKNFIKCELIKELIKIDEYDDIESKGNIVYKTNSKDFIIFSSNEGNLYKMQVSTKEIEVKKNFKSLFYNYNKNKNTGFFDEINNLFYLATESNYSIQISVFNSKNLNYLNSFFIYNEMLPYIDNCLTIDNFNNIILITTNNILKIKLNFNYLNKNNNIQSINENIENNQDNLKFKIIKKQLLPQECIIPSSSVLNHEKNLLLLGCVSKYGIIYEINLNTLLINTNKHTFYYGSSIDSLLLGPINSFTFLEGFLNYPYHLVSFEFKDITSSSIGGGGSNSNGDSIVYRNRETYFGQANTGSSDSIRYGLYAFGHDILLFDLTEISNTPKDIDYISDCVATSSTYSPHSNTIILSTNSSSLYIYHLPSSSNGILKNINSKSLLIFLPILLIITILFLIILIKYIYKLYFKKKVLNINNINNGYIEF